MQFCLDHWDRLRAKLNDRGLSALIPTSGEKAVTNLKEQLEGAPATIDNYDPLMGAFWAIVSNLVERIGLAVMMHEGCPICYGNELHEQHCKFPGECTFEGFDYMLDRAADEQVDIWKELGEAHRG